MEDREIIELSEHIVKSFLDQDYELYDENEDLDFEYIEANIVYTDMGKAYSTVEVILKRKLDDKFFRFTYTDSEYCTLDETLLFPVKCREVFPKTITKVIYK